MPAQPTQEQLHAVVRQRTIDLVDAILDLLAAGPSANGSDNADELLTSTEVADLLRVPVGSVYDWRSRQVGPRGVNVGRHVRYRRSDVDAWLDQQAEAPTQGRRRPPGVGSSSHPLRTVSG